jgi:hypothetical protein
MFEKASRLKLRFNTPKGVLAVEDLWDLPLSSARTVSLDDLAKALNRALKESEEESFVAKASKKNEELQLSFDVVKHVIAVKLAERDAESKRLEAKEKKERILAIIADKQDEQLKSATLEELQNMVADL